MTALGRRGLLEALSVGGHLLFEDRFILLCLEQSVAQPLHLSLEQGYADLSFGQLQFVEIILVQLYFFFCVSGGI